MVKKNLKKHVQEIGIEKQRTYWFFRILTIWILVVIWFLMLWESLNLFRFYIWKLALSNVYPVIIILSTIILRNYKRAFWKIFWLLLFLLVFGWFFSVWIYTSLNQYSKSSFAQTIKNNVYRSPLVNISIKTFIWSINLAWWRISYLVDGKYKSDRNLIIESHLYSGTSSFSIEEEKNRNILQDYQTNLDLKIARNQPISLYIKNLLWQHIIDMRDIYRKDLKIHLWFGDLNIILGDKIMSWNLLQIQDSLANIKIQIPDDIWVQLYSKRLIGYMRWDLIKKWNNYYESTNISSAKQVVKIDIKSGLWLIDIVRIQK